VLKLIIEDDEGRKTVVPFVRDEITIGRQEGNTIRLTERNVSRRHARLLRQQANVLIEDLGSYNGIRVNGDRITGQVPVQDGDLIQIGDYDLAIQREEEARPAPATVPLDVPRAAPAPPSMAATMKLPDMGATLPALPIVTKPQDSDDVPDAATDEVPRNQSTAVIRINQVQAGRPQRSSAALDPSEAPRLVVLNTDFAGREFPCTKTELRIGRTDDNDIAIDHRSLSRTHCKVVREDSGEWKVIDMQSANGLMVNGESYAQVTLRTGDVLELGHVKLKFVGPGESVSLEGVTSNITTESPAEGASRGPLIAVAVAVLVIVAGGGGYAFYRSMTPVTPSDPPKPTATAPNGIEPVKVPGATPPAERPGLAPVPVPVADTAAENDRLVSQAIALLGKADFGGAEAALRQCKVADSPCPAGRPVLNAIPAEKQVAKALDEAAAALKAGRTDEAGRALDAARNTQYQQGRLGALEAEHRRQVQAALTSAKVAKQAPPAPAPEPAADTAERTQALLEQARAANKKQEYGKAIDSLTECLSLDKKHADCIVVLASAYARRGARDSNDKDLQLAEQNYKRFLEVAPPDHRQRKRVEEILAGK
jgi:pSer/pThr/pTyr-binding forkhead associated (FHA) protein